MAPGSRQHHTAPKFPFPPEPLEPSVEGSRSRGEAIGTPRPLEICEGEEQAGSSQKQEQFWK